MDRDRVVSGWKQGKWSWDKQVERWEERERKYYVPQKPAVTVVWRTGIPKTTTYMGHKYSDVVDI
jgi:hypothetical protein